VEGRIRGRDQATAWPKNTRKFGDAGVEVMEVEQHPRRDNAIEGSVVEGKGSGITDVGVDATLARQLDHARRDINHDDGRAELDCDPRRKLAGSAADLEHPLRHYLGDGLEHDLARIGAFGVRVDGSSSFELRFGRVLPRNRGRVVDPHRSTIGRPGAPLPGCFAPSQAEIVAPTSPISPS
jgi:hypothetical protein